MKAIKLWHIGSGEGGIPAASSVATLEETKTEEQLENLLTHCPELLIEDLKIIGRQTDTPGGPLDLLGVDPDGRIVVFELKRGALSRDAVAQVIDYASYISELEAVELSRHISEKSGNLGTEKISDFTAWYNELFNKPVPNLQKPRMILVGLGADDRTRRMVSFLADSDIDISLITFHAFNYEGKLLLAKQVEVEAITTEGGQRYSKKANLEKLQKKVIQLGISTFFYEMAEFFRTLLPAYEWPSSSGYSYGLSELTETGSPTNRVYISLYIYDSKPGQAEIRIHPRAVEVSADNFADFKKKMGKSLKERTDRGVEVWINSIDVWGEVKPKFNDFLQGVIDGWKRKTQQKVAQEFQEAEGDKESEVPEVIQVDSVH